MRYKTREEVCIGRKHTIAHWAGITMSQIIDTVALFRPRMNNARRDWHVAMTCTIVK